MGSVGLWWWMMDDGWLQWFIFTLNLLRWWMMASWFWWWIENQILNEDFFKLDTLSSSSWKMKIQNSGRFLLIVRAVSKTMEEKTNTMMAAAAAAAAAMSILYRSICICKYWQRRDIIKHSSNFYKWSMMFPWKGWWVHHMVLIDTKQDWSTE